MEINKLNDYYIYVVDTETTANGYQDSPSAVFRNNRVLTLGKQRCAKGLKWDTVPSRCSKFMNTARAWNKSVDDGADVIIVGHNLQFDLKYMMRDQPDGPWHKMQYWDTAIAEYLLSGHTWMFPSLEASCDKRGVPYTKRLDLGSYLKGGGKMEDIPIADLNKYCDEDVEATRKLFEQQIKDISEEEFLFILRHCNKLPSICSIELNGMEFNIGEAQDKIISNTARISSLIAAILGYTIDYQGWGLPIGSDEHYHIRKHLNPMSNKTIAAFLTGQPSTLNIGKRKAEKRELKCISYLTDAEIEYVWGSCPIKYTGNHPSVSESILQKVLSIRPKDPYVTWLLEYRLLLKETDTYLGPLTDMALFDPDNKIYTNINMTSTRTGRTSSSVPNFQNMPDFIRSLFSVRDNLKEIDFSQLEVCVIAELSEDEQLIQDIKDGVDIHYEVGRTVMGWTDPKQMNDKDRRTVKSVVFGLCYGGGPKTLGEQAGITTALAKKIIEAFYTRYPGVKEWHDLLIETSKKEKVPEGFHEDGTQAHTFSQSDIRRSNRVSVFKRFWRHKTEATPDFIREPYGFQPTKLKNYPVQGIAGGDIVLTFVSVLFYLVGGELSPIRIVNTVHDSIVVSVPSEMEEQFNKWVDVAVKYTEKVYEMKVPLTVKTKGEAGSNTWR